MNLSLRWLKEFVDIGNIEPREFSEAMTMSGSKVELFEIEGDKIDKIVVGKIVSMEKPLLKTVPQSDYGFAGPDHCMFPIITFPFFRVYPCFGAFRFLI